MSDFVSKETLSFLKTYEQELLHDVKELRGPGNSFSAQRLNWCREIIRHIELGLKTVKEFKTNREEHVPIHDLVLQYSKEHSVPENWVVVCEPYKIPVMIKDHKPVVVYPILILGPVEK